MIRFIGSSAVAFALLVPGVASAQWQTLDNFESLTPGSLNGQNGWVDNGGGGGTLYNVVNDPDDAGNQVLRVDRDPTMPPPASSAYKTLGAPIVEGATGTVFARFRVQSVGGSQGNLVFGTSRLAAPSDWSHYAGYGVAGGQSSAAGTFQARDGAAFNDFPGAYQSNVWTNVWMVLDNNLDQTRYYLSEGNNAPVELTDANAPYGFRNGTDASDLLTFMIRTVNTTTDELQFIDDIYFDPTTANLTNPVPEPSAGLLFFVGCLAAARRGSRSKRRPF